MGWKWQTVLPFCRYPWTTIDDPYIVKLATRNEKPTCELTAEMIRDLPLCLHGWYIILYSYIGWANCQVELATWPACLRSSTK
jgi:hypothetical protein